MNNRSAVCAQLLILGDDLSGTADCAVTGTHCGLGSVVSLEVDHTAETASHNDVAVLAVDTDTRRQPPEIAARTNVLALRAHGAGRRLYKKIDSTLRGNVAAEVAALVDMAGMAIVAPAYPHAGRTTQEGRQFVFGVPVEETEVWKNEQIAGQGDVCAMLSEAGLRVARISLGVVREGVDRTRERLLDLQAENFQAVVCDGESDEDLATVAAASANLDRLFWVGSAGLAKPLFEALSISKDMPSAAVPQEASTLARTTDSRGVLVVVGSMSDVSHQQIATLQNHLQDLLETFEVDAEQLLDPVAWATLPLTNDVTHALMRGHHVVVNLRQSNRVAFSNGALLARRLADRLAPAAAQASALIATGGETARAMLSAMGIAHLEVVEEIDPGVPLLLAQSRERGLFPVVTKAGGFGRPETLYHAWRRLVAMQHADAQAPRQFTEKEVMTNRPVIGITMGDAAGVGPEIIMKSLAHASVYEACRPLVIGDAKRLAEAGKRAGVTLNIHSISSPEQALFRHGEVDCIDLHLIPEDLPFGKLSAIAGDAAYQYIARTVELTSAGKLDAICTAPLNKEALHAGGHIFPGHTEMLAHLTGVPEVSMMLVAPKLRVIHVTTHIGLLDAIRRIEPGLVQRTIERAHETLVRAGISAPRIGVCGINPHAGENGLFGYGEEEEKIVPAVELLCERGWDVEGPLPADTLFFRAGRGDFDVVVAMYHDQGHGPVKVMGLEAGVNVTVGLPVIRTSVDHGTAFDIAGKGIADERSMLEALKQAKDLATLRVETQAA